MSGELHCDLCAVSELAHVKLRRFSLIRRAKRLDQSEGRWGSRGAGAIVLCERCWRTTCAPRMNRAKRPLRPRGMAAVA